MAGQARNGILGQPRGDSERPRRMTVCSRQRRKAITTVGCMRPGIGITSIPTTSMRLNVVRSRRSTATIRHMRVAGNGTKTMRVSKRRAQGIDLRSQHDPPAKTRQSHETLQQNPLICSKKGCFQRKHIGTKICTGISFQKQLS